MFAGCPCLFLSVRGVRATTFFCDIVQHLHVDVLEWRSSLWNDKTTIGVGDKARTNYKFEFEILAPQIGEGEKGLAQPCACALRCVVMGTMLVLLIEQPMGCQVTLLENWYILCERLDNFEYVHLYNLVLSSFKLACFFFYPPNVQLSLPTCFAYPKILTGKLKH